MGNTPFTLSGPHAAHVLTNGPHAGRTVGDLSLEQLRDAYEHSTARLRSLVEELNRRLVVLIPQLIEELKRLRASLAVVNEVLADPEVERDKALDPNYAFVVGVRDDLTYQSQRVEEKLARYITRRQGA